MYEASAVEQVLLGKQLPLSSAQTTLCDADDHLARWCAFELPCEILNGLL